MKRRLLRLLFAFAVHFLSISLIAQKHFNLTVVLPNGIIKEKLKVILEDGKQTQKIIGKETAQGRLLFKGDYYAMYAPLTIDYPDEGSVKGFADVFFIREKPAVISFLHTDVPDSPFKKYVLENVQDFKKEKKQMADYCSAEVRKEMDYVNKHGDKIFSGSDTAIRNYYFKVLVKDRGKKKLNYITKNLDSYYSFYVFENEIARHAILPADSLLMVFNTFPDKFKYTDEGNYVDASLRGRLLVPQKSNAVDFVASDVNKTKVTLSQYKGKKYVLLHFWATWCTPCMKELPALQEISTSYKAKDLQIISVALPSSKYTDYMATIKRHKMDWIQIYNDMDLFNKYGNQPTPRLCLIDKSGKLIYDSNEDGQRDNLQLSRLKKVIAQALN